MFRYEKIYVSPDVENRDALGKRLTDNGATLVTTVGEPDVVHIFNSFEGATFEDCVKKSCRVLGVPCVQESLRSGRPPPRAPHPVYSRAMEGLVVAGEVEEKAKLKNYVNYMFGAWMDEIGVGTQYFVTTEPGSLHYMWALELGVNIVQPSWILEVWERQTLTDFKTHLLPPLSGCTVSVTGLSTASRASIQHLVTHYGGKYSQQLSRRVTHLLCDKPKGRKYMTALAWGIHIISTSWLFDSINAKGALDVSRYELPAVPLGSELDGAEGLYMRSPYSRSSPYGPLSSSSASRRLNYSAPILVRRHRTSMGTNYTPIFPLPPSQHMHAPPSSHSHLPVFAQTTQIQSGQSSHHSTSSSMMSSLPRQSSSLTFSQQKSQPSRSSREGRTNMDRYRDLFDQLTGMLRMCDDLIEKCNHTNMLQNTTTTNPIPTSNTTPTPNTTYSVKPNLPNDNTTPSNSDSNASTSETTPTTTETNTNTSENNNNTTNTSTLDHQPPTDAPSATLPPSSASLPPTSTPQIDVDMDSDEDATRTPVSTETTSSEEK